jgi:hypothetical protein
MAIKEITFDIRSKPSGKVQGVIKDKEENLNRFNYSKDFEIDSPSTINSDVYHMELGVPPEFAGIEGTFHIMLDGGKFYESDVKNLPPGQNVLDIDHVVTKGHRLSAVLEYTHAKSLGHYTLQLKLESR